MDLYAQGRRASDSGSYKLGNKTNLEKLYNKAIGNNKSPATSLKHLQEELVSQQKTGSSPTSRLSVLYIFVQSASC